MSKNPYLTFCPVCKEDTLLVDITDSGIKSSEDGSYHWFEGDGKCSQCGWSGFYQDSE